MFRNREFTFWKTIVYIGMVYYVLRTRVYAVHLQDFYTGACKTHHKIPVYTTAILMMNPPFPNM